MVTKQLLVIRPASYPTLSQVTIIEANNDNSTRQSNKTNVVPVDWPERKKVGRR